ncbi:hypothetical protein JCM5350_002295 [Sporobolomyces pararoseus]
MAKTSTSSSSKSDKKKTSPTTKKATGKKGNKESPYLAFKKRRIAELKEENTEQSGAERVAQVNSEWAESEENPKNQEEEEEESS